MDPNNSLADALVHWSGTLSFLECSYMLNAAPVTNPFLSYTWLSLCFFSASWLLFIWSVIDENVLLLWSLRWQEIPQGNEGMCSNSELGNFVYLKVLFAEPNYELRISSSISFLHHKSQKNKMLENILEFRQQICHWNVLIVLVYW